MHFLIVDDERHALDSLVDVVRQAAPDAQSTAFQNPREALAFARDNHIDVAFLDIDMGGMSGIVLAKELKENDPKTNIIFVTVHDEYATAAFSLRASGYLIKPAEVDDVKNELQNLRDPLAASHDRGLSIVTFGNFEAYYNGKPLHFARSKSKELLAYLVHKRGTGCSGKEIASVLFEDAPYTLSLQRQVQTIIHTLVKTLDDVGCKDVVIRNYNNLALDTSKVDCDYYRFIGGDAEAVNRYVGEYMANYSWAEFTSAYLMSKDGYFDA